MDKNEYIKAYKLVESLEENVTKKLPRDVDSLRITEVMEDGVEISTEYSHCGGCGTDYGTIFFTWEEVAMEPMPYSIHILEKNRIAAVVKKAVEEAAKELKKKEDAVLKEEADRKQYEKLKAKFENNA